MVSLEVDPEQHIALPFASQGIGVREALLELGLLSEGFYDTIRGADPADTNALEDWWGKTLPEDYGQFLAEAGDSLGTLRIEDWRTVWEFRPAALLEYLHTRPADECRQRKRAGRLPIALLGPTMEVGYDHQVCLTYDVATGAIVPEDPTRCGYQDLTSFLLEWGHRLLDPRMAVRVRPLRAWDSAQLRPARIREVHALAASHLGSEGRCYVGGWLGVYQYQRCGLILRMDGRQQLWVEGYVARRVDPGKTVAGAVLREGQERGWLRT